MAFKVADKKNDKARNVVRKNRYSLHNFWSAGMPGEGFVITGGHEDEQIWGLYHAVEDYIQRTQCPVIILHNNRNVDKVLKENLCAHFPGLKYEKLGGILKNYMPFDGMSKAHIVTAVKNQCRHVSGVNELKVGQYMNSLLTILEQYKTSNALCHIAEVCNSSDAEIVGLAERAGLGQMIKNDIQLNVEAGTEVREVIRDLTKSFSGIYNGRDGSWINMGRFIKQRTGNRVLSLCIGAADADPMLMALRDELALLKSEKFLLVLYDVGINERNGLGDMLANPLKRFSLGICSAEVSGMFSGNAVEAFSISRARVKKWMILSYTDANAAAKISNLLASYMMEQTVEVKAPKYPWELFTAKAPGKAKVKMEKLEPDEICAIGYQNAILYGHSGTDLLFVTGKLDYSIGK